MGFTTGFLGGLTLTYSILYYSLYVHRANRSVQRTLVSQSATLLNSAVDPPPELPDPPAYEVRKAGLAEELKDRWNTEIEKLVHNFQETDWAEKRALLEEQVVAAWRKVKSSESAHELEFKARELEQRVKDTVTAGTEKVKDTVAREAELVKNAIAHETGKVKDAVARETDKTLTAAEDKVKDQTPTREKRLLEL
ncbi:hypothetical protein ABEF92_001294 [Exophiala dermatitidis]|uniref:MICOS complex subunit MIC12 n=1 Tax=Exophiala dermatitidis (strain ATCC 34100 / CBS 525.76 / NIH/UT8656) TaxID=858893 RepID=H6BYT5_EXODN|nr:uncharacterized protein HMPREF1120_04864 [Exophiala dermatitidis NIH/UT8656]EHY56798.1 hypothetical protein HMPREF1120_04864 [Exophiala dermatitidis NIH/UT8656]